MTKFNISSYSDAYYLRHFSQYRMWENLIGEHIVQTINPTSILDLGCGVGSYLEGALRAGCKNILGIEIAFDTARKYFTEDINPHIRKGDITTNLNLNRSFDCVMSFEVGEHIDPEDTVGFLDNLTRLSSNYIILTAAPPGQRGTGHINLRERQVWINDIVSRGFSYRPELVNSFWPVWKKFGAPKYILRNLMVFKKDAPSWKNYRPISHADKSYLLHFFPPNHFDYFVDIGAQHGWVSNEFAERNPSTKVLSFEPVVSEYEQLLEKTRHNSNIQAFNLALGNGKPLFWKRKSSGWHIFIEDNTKGYQIQSKTLHEIFTENKIDPATQKVFLKIDCEGGERFILDDHKSINIMKKCQHIGMEIHFTFECVANRHFHLYKFPNYSVYREWVENTFQDSHMIKYHCSKRLQGIGTYVLTKR